MGDSNLYKHFLVMDAVAQSVFMDVMREFYQEIYPSPAQRLRRRSLQVVPGVTNLDTTIKIRSQQVTSDGNTVIYDQDVSYSSATEALALDVIVSPFYDDFVVELYVQKLKEQGGDIFGDLASVNQPELLPAGPSGTPDSVDGGRGGDSSRIGTSMGGIIGAIGALVVVFFVVSFLCYQKGRKDSSATNERDGSSDVQVAPSRDDAEVTTTPVPPPPPNPVALDTEPSAVWATAVILPQTNEYHTHDDARPKDYESAPPTTFEELPSNLEYKDQGRDFTSVMQQQEQESIVARIHTPTVDNDDEHDATNNNNPPAINGSRDLPSHIDYKDQGRDFVSVMQQQEQESSVASVEAPSVDDEHNAHDGIGAEQRLAQDLPSDLSYKDQGRDFSDFIR